MNIKKITTAILLVSTIVLLLLIPSIYYFTIWNNEKAIELLLSYYPWLIFIFITISYSLINWTFLETVENILDKIWVTEWLKNQIERRIDARMQKAIEWWNKTLADKYLTIMKKLTEKWIKIWEKQYIWIFKDSLSSENTELTLSEEANFDWKNPKNKNTNLWYIYIGKVAMSIKNKNWKPIFQFNKKKNKNTPEEPIFHPENDTSENKVIVKWLENEIKDIFDIQNFDNQK